MSERRDALLKGFDQNQYFMENIVERNIAAYRKGLARIRIVDEKGQPISGAEVSLNQKSHDFNFGCTLFLLDEMETAEKNAAYREKFKEVFNYAVAPFYWSDLEPEEGKPRYAADSPKVYRRPAPDLVLEYCEANGIRVKGHCLIYHKFIPSWYPKDDVPTQKRLMEAHLKEVADRYAGRIQDWDVENENLSYYRFPDFKAYEEPDYLEWCFKSADRAFTGGNRLFINEGQCVWSPRFYNGLLGTRSIYYSQIHRLLSEGVRLDGAGMQFHQFIRKEDELGPTSLPFNPIELYEAMDCYGSLGIPLQISEITIPAYSGTPDEEQVQMELAKNLYRTWFSHPAIDAIVWWNLVDGYTYVAPDNSGWNENYYGGGLLRHNLSEKPAFQALRQLIREEWHTCEQLHTNEDGIVEFEGFFGNYSLTINGNAVDDFHLSKGDRELKIIRA